ncbi:MAG: hypothetical protein HFE74_04725 [Firmicutes bacterium]|nr:hypothetical protein [Bacillota bacterium]
MKVKYRELNFSAHRVKVKIEGFRIDRLIDKAMKRGLDIRNIKMVSSIQAVCWMTPADVKELRKLAKSLYKITEEAHKGPEYRMKKFIKAPIKVAGVIVVLAVVISQSFFVKTIEVNGYKGIPETLLRQCLAESGVKEGVYRPKIDWEKAENHIYDTFPQITWLKLAYDGRKVILNVAETENPVSGIEDETGGLVPSSQSEEKKYTNIIAKESGYIETISSYRGMILAEEGDYVQKGQVLISGYVPIEPTVYEENWPKAYYVRCNAEIWAKVPYRLTFNQERYLRETDKQGKTIISKKEKTEKEIKAKANQQIRQWAKENLPEDAEILNKDLNFSYKENIIEVSVTIEVRQQIGEEQEILIGEESTDTSGD